MSSENTKTVSETQAPKEQRSVDDLLDNVTQFIDSVYRDLSILSPSPPSNSNRSRQSLISCSPQRSSDTSLNSTASPEGASAQPNSSTDESFASAKMPTSRRSIDADIERINRICDTVDQNLRSIGLYVNTGRGSAITNPSNNGRGSANSNNINDITFCAPSNPAPPSSSTVGGSPRRSHRAATKQRSQPAVPISLPDPHFAEVVDEDDDEVVLVSSDLPPVIDLCTPSHEAPRRPTVNRNELTRRNLEQHVRPDDQNPVVPVRRRRVSKPPSQQDIQIFPDSETEGNKSTMEDDGGGETSNHTPFMCPVCMESCLKRKPTSTKCGHVYCEQCIKQAIRLTHKCPMCKTRISCSQLFRIYV